MCCLSGRIKEYIDGCPHLLNQRRTELLDLAHLSYASHCIDAGNNYASALPDKDSKVTRGSFRGMELVLIESVPRIVLQLWTWGRMNTVY